MGASRYVDLEVLVIMRETDRAFLVMLDDGEEEWLPKSQIADPDDYGIGDENVTLLITEWLANQKGL